MRRKFLSVVLCVCMMMTMAPFAFAAGETEIQASTTELSNGSYILKNDITLTSGALTIPENATVSINLNNHKLTNKNGDHTILNNGTLTITGRGTVDNVSNGTAALYNNAGATATLNGGTYTRSCEASTSADNSGGNSYYTLKNFGTMTINPGVTVNQGADGNGKYSSLIANGWYDGSTQGQDAKEPAVQHDGAKMTINGGTFNGGLNTIKNDDYGTLTINSGTFQNYAQHAFFNANVATINGGTFVNDGTRGVIYTYAKWNDTYGKGTLDINGGIFVNKGTSIIEKSATNATVNITGGVFSSQVAGSTKKGSLYVYPSTNAVAGIDNYTFSNVADAVYAAAENDTITLVADATILNPILVNKSIVLDLNGKTITTKCRQAFEIIAYTGFDGGSLKVTGEGTINANSKIGTFYLSGTESASTATNKKSELVIDKDVKVTNSQYTIWVDVARASEHSCNVNVDISGTIEGEEPLYVNGQIKPDASNVPVIHIGKDARFSMNEVELYLAGYTKTTIEDGATLTNKKGNVITITAGELTINGGTFSGGNTIVKNIAGTGGAITTDTSSAIFIRQHTTRQDLKVTINGGTFTAAVPFYQATGQEDESNIPQPNKVSLSITGGYFASNRSAADGGVAIKSDDKTGFITGGYFNTDPTAYCGTKDSKKLTGIPSGNSSYPFTIGEINAAVKVAEGNSDAKNAPDNSTFDNSLTKEAVKQVASSATASLSGASGEVAKDINETTITDATTKLNGLVTGNKTVVVLVQPYLEITPTGSSIENDIKSISLNIEPKYNLIATTSDVVVSDPSNIKITNGNDKNAVLMESAKPLTVTTPTPVTVTLPTGFATVGNSVYIKHEASNGKIYYYTAIVGEDCKITFTTKNGFSPFTISTTSEAIAEVDGIGYATFQAAVDAVENGGTIKALKNINSTVSGNKTFTVNANSKTVTLTAASGYSLTKDAAGKYTVSRQSSGGPGSSGGSIATPTTYAVNVNAATNGVVAADKKMASKGTTVTVTASPSKGYVVDAVKVVDKDGKDVAVIGKDGKYVFTMPGSAVTVTGTFKAETPVALPFTDVKSGDWFYPAVQYAYAQGLMTGTSATTFAPNGTMNRAMIVTVLYRLEKSPAVTGASKFTDVPAGQWYSDAVAWAAANKIVNGYDETTFGPMNAVTREQMAAILFRYEQVKGLENVTLEENLNRFPDQNKISAYAIPALQWAVGQKIINGNADGTLDPTGTATRAQVAQIFTNLLNK